MSVDEVPPPWVKFPTMRYRHIWETSSIPWVKTEWRVFWDALDDAGRAAYLVRHPPPGDWPRFIQEVGFDREVAAIDAADIASGVLRPDGSPWPSAAPPRSTTLFERWVQWFRK